jgi:hypothetical protein
MKLHCIRATITAGDIEFSFSMWCALIFGVLPDGGEVANLPGPPDFDSARTVLLRQWDAPLPVVLSVDYQPPGWTLDPLETLVIGSFHEFVMFLGEDGDFRVLNGFARKKPPSIWQRIFSRNT